MRTCSHFRHFAAVLCIGAAGSGVVGAAPDLRLIQAVRNKDPQAVRTLLSQRIDVNAPQGDGATALHWAARVDDLAIADILLRAGARAAVANDNGATPLHLACLNRSAAMVDRLLRAGADTNAAMVNGETVLMTCSRSGTAEAVKALLVKGARVNAKETAHDQTALMWAAAQRHSDVVRLLTEAGADLRARSKIYPQIVAPYRYAASRTRRAELHGARRRLDSALFCSTVRRRGVCTAVDCCRRGSKRSSARWHEPPSDGCLQRPCGSRQRFSSKKALIPMIWVRGIPRFMRRF